MGLVRTGLKLTGAGGVAIPKFLAGQHVRLYASNSIFVWDAAIQSTK